MRIVFILLMVVLSQVAQASQLSYSTTYASNGTVTAANLNGNFNDAKNIINGGLDNTNANTTTGFRFYETLSALPSSSLSQGRTVFLTTDNTWNVYTGSAWKKMGAMTYYDYGTSASAYTSYDYTSVKVAYGQAVSVATNSSSVITNLPFTSFTTYRCSVSASTSSTTNISPPVYVGNSGSQMTVYNTDDSSALSIMWICTGT